MSMHENAADANVARALRLETATLSDALDRLGIAGQCLGIKPLNRDQQIAGRAYTCAYAPLGVAGGTVGDFIDDVPPGAIIAIDNGGREDATVWGDIMTTLARKNAIAGTVIDGACRDIALALRLGYPIYSRSTSMRTGKDRVQLEATQIAINVGDARVAPGDILRGDADGVLAIPRAREDEVLSLAETIDAAERAIISALEQGSRLDDARQQLGYHTLQRRTEAS